MSDPPSPEVPAAMAGPQPPAPPPVHQYVVQPPAPSADAYAFGKLADMIGDAAKTFASATSERAQADLEIAKESTKVEELRTKREELAITKTAEHAKYREWTVRVLGGIAVVGFFAFPLVALLKGLIHDPIAALSTLATVAIALILLADKVRGGGTRNKRKGAGEDDEPE